MKSKWRNLTVRKQKYKYTCSLPRTIHTIKGKSFRIGFQPKLIIHTLKDNKKQIIPYEEVFKKVNTGKLVNPTYGGKILSAKVVAEYIEKLLYPVYPQYYSRAYKKVYYLIKREGRGRFEQKALLRDKFGNERWVEAWYLESEDLYRKLPEKST